MTIKEGSALNLQRLKNIYQEAVNSSRVFFGKREGAFKSCRRIFHILKRRQKEHILYDEDVIN